MLVPMIRQCILEKEVATLTVKEGEQEEHKQRWQDVKIAFS